MKHIEGTRTGDCVTGNVPIGSVVKDTFGFWPERKVTDVIFAIDYMVIIHLSSGDGIRFVLGDKAEHFVVISPGPIVWYHRLWNWLADKVNKRIK